MYHISDIGVEEEEEEGGWLSVVVVEMCTSSGRDNKVRAVRSAEVPAG